MFLQISTPTHPGAIVVLAGNLDMAVSLVCFFLEREGERERERERGREREERERERERIHPPSSFLNFRLGPKDGRRVETDDKSSEHEEDLLARRRSISV